jgi:S-adenosylmethionine:tRNA ribosyltransferase-isomerase
MEFGLPLWLFAPMHLSEFDYNLPESAIATAPAVPRDHSRLMAIDRRTGVRAHRHFYEIGEFLRPGDLLVLNNTRVVPARLFGHDTQGRRFEVFLTRRIASEPPRWQCLVRPGKRVNPGPVRLVFSDGTIAAVRRTGEREYEVAFPGIAGERFEEWLSRTGTLPLPPYIKRAAATSDRADYQTVYARIAGSVAAPTAGLHFTGELLDSIRQAGIETAELTLTIGYGTFSPIRTEAIDDHTMHEEEYAIDEAVMERLHAAKREGRRVIAVGTTALRALESIPDYGSRGSTRLFIRPGFAFRFTDGLITNFHLPKSSLFILVASFLGLERTRECYREAVEKKYRFFSYGDAMVIL